MDQETRMVCLDDFENFAAKHLNKSAFDYYRSGANQEQTLRENIEAFRRLKLRPRLLRNVSCRDLSTTILGQPVSFPVGVAPTAMQKMAHPDGEVATARAAAAVGTVMTLSTIATSSIEEVAEAKPNGLLWFQLYIYRDRKVTEELVRRAENAGYRALVLTIDTPMFGLRLPDARNKFSLPRHLRMANFGELDIKSNGIQEAKKESGLNEYAASLFDPSITWKDILWLKEITKLPLVVKGVLTAEDAKLALEYGASAILVSNHGARQLDGVPASVEVLPEIVQAVRGRCEIYLDGGVRTGTDVLKALALGARAVFVGRPLLWGLVYNGEQGAIQVLQMLKKELDLAMALAGCSRISDISSALIVKSEFYSKL
ncbi:2-Hydroxyacid oxidase 1-like isoform X2 [Tachypleus tridentatus]|uniref:2-Hydroxyacid oxidase 1-like isoform X2 n=1 Tax=Tachypleus tridentatus TaxID=6853 RepID=UPI003FD2C2E5